jgi:ATP-dependent Clp protease ATP-binding subunit ClpA
VVGDESGTKTLGFVFPEGPVLPRPERDIIEAGKKRAAEEAASGDEALRDTDEERDERPAPLKS